MLIYVGLLALIILLGAIFVRENQKKRKIYFLILCFILFTLVASLRSFSVGTDTNNYVSLYGSIALLDWNQLWDYSSAENVEFCYVLYNKILSAISHDPRLLIVTSSVITNAAMFLFIGRNSKNVLISFIIYLTFLIFFETMNTMRETLALAILLFGFEVLKRRRWWCTLLFLLFFALAVSFHYAAIFGIVLVPLVAFNFSLIPFILSIAALVLIYIYAIPVYQFFMIIAGRSGAIQPEFTANGEYVHSVIAILIFIFFSSVLYLYRDREKLRHDFLRMRYQRKMDWPSFYLFASFAYFALTLIATNYLKYQRIADLFQPFFMASVPYFLYEFPKKKRKIYSTLVVLAFIAYFVAIYFAKPGYQDVWNYSFL